MIFNLSTGPIGFIATMHFPAVVCAGAEYNGPDYPSVPRRAARAIFLFAFVMLATFGWLADAAAQAGGFSAVQRGSSGAASGGPTLLPPSGVQSGTFRVHLGVSVELLGYAELFNGCFDGDSGNWSVTLQPEF